MGRLSAYRWKSDGQRADIRQAVFSGPKEATVHVRLSSSRRSFLLRMIGPGGIINLWRIRRHYPLNTLNLLTPNVR